MNITETSLHTQPLPRLMTDDTRWVRVGDTLPTRGSIVPVWDGDYIYYASYWVGKLSGASLWIISCGREVQLVSSSHH